MSWYPLTHSHSLEKKSKGSYRVALQKRPKTFNEVFKSAYKMSSTESCGLFAPKWHCLWQTLDPAAKILWPEYATAIKTHPAEFDYIQARIKQLSQKKRKKGWNAPGWQTIIIDFLLILASCISGSTGEIILQNRLTDRPTYIYIYIHKLPCTQAGHSVDVVRWSRGQGFGSDLAWIPAHNYFRSTSIKAPYVSMSDGM